MSMNVRSLLGLALFAAFGCGDEGATTPTPTPVSTAGPARTASGVAAIEPSSSVPPQGSASALTTTSAPPKPPPSRPLRTGEQAQVERAFPATALFDMNHSFQVELVGLGNCSFVSERVRAGATGDEADDDAPPPAPSASSSGAVPAAPTARATGSASTSAPAPTAASVREPRGPKIAVFAFHLLCRKPGEAEVTRTTLEASPVVKDAWTPSQITAVSFPDLDGDGRQEIVIIATYDDADRTVPVVAIYRQVDGAYVLQPRWSDEANKAGADTVAKVRFAVDVEKLGG
ncbi:MAG: hypothetical protein AAF715_02025 [Myxococcota bacterium]